MSKDHKSNTDQDIVNENLLGDQDGNLDAETALGNLPDGGPKDDKEEVKSVPSLEEELAKVKDQLLRAMADAENTRKRAQREKEETAQYAVTNFARDLLSVADNLGRAIETLKSSDNDSLQPMIEGVEITEKELLKIFAKYKIEKIDALNQPFDHNLHQAMVEIPSEEKESGIVVQEMQVGYTIGNRLLRPAMVAVSK